MDLTVKVIRISCDAIMPPLPFFIDYSAGESSAPVPSSQCYRPAQCKQLIPQNF